MFTLGAPYVGEKVPGCWGKFCRVYLSVFCVVVYSEYNIERWTMRTNKL
jgi:hypothetical protein